MLKTFLVMLCLLPSAVLAQENTAATGTPSSPATASSPSEPQKSSGSLESSDQAVNVMYLAGVSYENIWAKNKDDEDLGGYGLSARVKLTYGKFFGFSPFLQTGLNWTSIGNVVTYKPLPSLTQEITTDVGAGMFEADIGASYPLRTNFELDALMGFRTSLFGNVSSSKSMGSTQEKSKEKIEKLNWLSTSLRGMYSSTPELKIGAELGYKPTGELKAKNAQSETISGYSLGLVGRYQF